MSDQPADNLMVLVPMSLIERIRAEVRLQCGDWAELDRWLDYAQDVTELPCDVRLPPATVFPAGSRVIMLLTAIRSRAGRPQRERKFIEAHAGHKENQ